eukprot:m.136972 g.136972  ORF g.136972 m.136972 type:complete len:455 (+) comp16985_c0_seq3:487-1851(+)
MSDQLSDEKLRAVFDLVDEERRGSIDVDQLQRLAQSTGLSSTEELDFLSRLDHDGEGRIDFDNFKRGVHTLLKRRSTTDESNGYGNHVESPIPHGVGHESFEGVGELDKELDVTTPVTRNGLSRRISTTGVRTPKGRSPMRRATSVTGFSASSLPESSLLEAEISVLRGQVQRLQEQNNGLDDELQDLSAKHTLLQKRCYEYEKALKDAEEQSKLSRDKSIDEMSSSLARISQEKEIVEESFQERTEDLEAEVARLQELNAQLTTSLESERRAAIAAEERAASVGSRLAEADDQAYQAQEHLKERIAQVTQESQALLDTAVKRERVAVETEMATLRKQVQTVMSHAEKERRDHDEHVRSLEAELTTLREKHSQLELALADPAEYERQLIQSGLRMMGGPDNGDSLAAELNEASRDDLLDNLRKLGDESQQLRGYIDTLLATVIDRIPDILEIRK